MIAQLYLLSGPRIALYSSVCIVASLMLGFFEIMFGLSIYEVLSSYGLLPQAPSLHHGFAAARQNISPITILIVAALFVSATRVLLSAFPGIIYESFQHRVRMRIVDSSFSSATEDSHISVADAANALAVLSPRSGYFLSTVIQLASVIALSSVLILAILGLSPKLSAITLISGLAMVLPLFIFRKLSQSYSHNFYTDSSGFMDRSTKDIRNIPFIKISGATDSEREILREKSHRALVNYKNFMIALAAQAGFPVLGGVFVVILILEINMKTGALDFAQLVPFVYLLSRFAGAVSSLVSSIGSLGQNKRFLKALLEMQEHSFRPFSSPQRGIAPPSLTSLDVANLTVSRSTVLCGGISFSLRAGDMLLISGESGRGKSSLILTLIGFLPHASGSIKWSDTELSRIDIAALCAKVGYAGADPFLLDASIRDNLVFGLGQGHVSDEQCSEVLKLVCADFVFDLNGSLDFVLREGGGGISAGQKQRLAIARALLRSPDVLFLDEATANIDETTEAVLVENIRRQFPNLIIIAVSHRKSLRTFATSMIDL